MRPLAVRECKSAVCRHAALSSSFERQALVVLDVYKRCVIAKQGQNKMMCKAYYFRWLCGLSLLSVPYFWCSVLLIPFTGVTSYAAATAAVLSLCRMYCRSTKRATGWLPAQALMYLCWCLNHWIKSK